MNVRQMWAAKLAGQAVPASGPLPRMAAAVSRAAARVSADSTGSLQSDSCADRRGAAGRAANFAQGSAQLHRPPFAGVVLGIDPSLRGTGLALVEFRSGGAPILLRCQTVRVSPRVPMSGALAEIHRAVVGMLETMPVRHVALEQTIYVQNFQTAQILGAARGAAIAAAALRELPVFEYPPLRVKQAVAGLGRASKHQVARTVMALFGHGTVLAPDEADAAGVALCHAFTWRDA